MEQDAGFPVAPSATTAQIIGELRRWGIHYLLTDQDIAPPAVPISAPQVLMALGQTHDPRVRDAFIALMLLHPTLAQVIPDAIAHSDPFAAESIQTLIMATLYEQRIWYPLLTMALGAPPQVPEMPFAPLWRAWQLPAPWRDFGLPGAHALAQHERERTGILAAYLGDWHNQIQHLVAQEWERHAAADGVRPLLIAPPWHVGQPREEDARMSWRPDVTRADIERFLTELGQQVRQASGRIYLVGGAALVHNAVRGQGASTTDIDIQLDVTDSQEVEQAIRQLKHRLGINVELASPADFIPLPSSWATMSPYVGRYGRFDVFYFDFYSLALSKIERGQARDLQDVTLLARQGIIQQAPLEMAYQQILPQLGTGRFFNIDSAQFTQKFAAVVAHLWPTP
jgi:predicted nucleotidyltransferase